MWPFHAAPPRGPSHPSANRLDFLGSTQLDSEREPSKQRSLYTPTFNAFACIMLAHVTMAKRRVTIGGEVGSLGTMQLSATPSACRQTGRCPPQGLARLYAERSRG